MGQEGWTGNGPAATLQQIGAGAAVLAALAPALGHGWTWGWFQPFVPADAPGAGVHDAGQLPGFLARPLPPGTREPDPLWTPPQWQGDGLADKPSLGASNCACFSLSPNAHMDFGI